jgi:hypothetical protein
MLLMSWSCDKKNFKLPHDWRWMWIIVSYAPRPQDLVASEVILLHTWTVLTFFPWVDVFFVELSAWPKNIENFEPQFSTFWMCNRQIANQTWHFKFGDLTNCFLWMLQQYIFLERKMLHFPFWTYYMLPVSNLSPSTPHILSSIRHKLNIGTYWVLYLCYCNSFLGRSNIVTGVAKTIKAHFQRHPFAIVHVKGRAKGTSVQEVVSKLEVWTLISCSFGYFKPE